MTCFSIFRDIEYEGKVNLNTITDPSQGSEHDFKLAYARFIRLFIGSGPHKLSESIPYTILTSSPSVRGYEEVSTSFKSLLRASLAFSKNTSLRESLRFMIDFNDSKILLDLFLQTVDYVNYHVRVGDDLRASYLGRLSLKQEAAGKVRVFAMVDA